MTNSTAVGKENHQAPEVPDQELLRRVLSGDAAAYEDLIRRHQGKIYGLIYNMTGNKEDTEDLVQDVFVKAFHSLAKFKGDSSFYTWLYRIGVNHTLNFLKKRKKYPQLSLDNVDEGIERNPAYLELSARESPVRDASLGELQQKLNKALLTLSEKHRAVVVMHDIQGIPHEEIARMLKCSHGTIRSRLFYARQQLQRELSEYAP